MHASKCVISQQTEVAAHLVKNTEWFVFIIMTHGNWEIFRFQFGHYISISISATTSTYSNKFKFFTVYWFYFHSNKNTMLLQAHVTRNQSIWKWYPSKLHSFVKSIFFFENDVISQFKYEWIRSVLCFFIFDSHVHHFQVFIKYYVQLPLRKVNRRSASIEH